MRVTPAFPVVAVLLIVAACGSDRAPAVDPPSTETRTLVADASFPVALVPLASGGFLYAERLTGRVRLVNGDGQLSPDPVARVDTRGSQDDQRGLVGLAESPVGRLFAAWTRASDGRLVVGELVSARVPTTDTRRADPEPARIVWVGPASAQLANGGHLAFSPDGTIVVGIGDLQADRALADDPSVANRKLLALDPSGPPDQVPQILSTGWNNPFAFTFTPDGTLWVADNTGGEGPERIGRGDLPASQALGLGREGDGGIAPSALVAIDDHRLGVCGYLTGRMQLVSIVDGSPTAPGADLADGCSVGAAVLTDGSLVVATTSEIRARRPLDS